MKTYRTVPFWGLQRTSCWYAGVSHGSLWLYVGFLILSFNVTFLPPFCFCEWFLCDGVTSAAGCLLVAQLLTSPTHPKCIRQGISPGEDGLCMVDVPFFAVNVPPDVKGGGQARRNPQDQTGVQELSRGRREVGGQESCF